MTIVAKVWIDEDCITCDACQDICPEVFEVNDDSSQILAAVHPTLQQMSSPNEVGANAPTPPYGGG